MGERVKLAIVALLFVVAFVGGCVWWVVVWRECRSFGHSWWYCAAQGR